MGEGGERPLLIVHGLFGSARNWRGIAKRLSADREVIVPDLRNHGESDHDPVHDYPALADDLADLIEGDADVIGHSMGGKAVMWLALTRPEKVKRLIVADIAPVAYEHSQQDYIDAMRGIDLSTVEKRSDADEQLKATVPEAGIRAFLLQSLDVKEKRWKLNLDALEAAMPEITGWPGGDATFEGPTLFIGGAESDYIQSEHRAEIRRHFPNAKVVSLPGAGHWLHAEAPEPFVETVEIFLGD